MDWTNLLQQYGIPGAMLIAYHLFFKPKAAEPVTPPAPASTTPTPATGQGELLAAIMRALQPKPVQEPAIDLAAVLQSLLAHAKKPTPVAPPVTPPSP